LLLSEPAKNKLFDGLSLETCIEAFGDTTEYIAALG
jgi:hypothetical protein